MRIALVILHADPSLGGAEGYTVNLARSLLQRGHEVTLLAQSFADNLPPANRVPLAAGGVTRLGRYLRFLGSLDEHLAGQRYDIVHAMLPVRRCDVYHPHAGLAAQAVEEGHLRYNDRLRRWLSRWGTRFNRKRRRFAAIERQVLEGPQPPVVLCLTEAMKRAAASCFRVDSSKLVKLFYGIDLERFDPQARPQARREVRARLNIGAEKVAALIVAQDFERKGVREAIAAIAQAGDERLVLIVVGRDKPDALRRFAARAGIADRVVFAGATSDVYAFYKAADFLLFPARVDPCPLVVLESAAMGLPVIVTRQAGSHEAITPGRQGLVVDDPRDVAAMAQAVRQLLDESLRQRMGAAALELRPMLSQERHVNELLAVYQARAYLGGATET